MRDKIEFKVTVEGRNVTVSGDGIEAINGALLSSINIKIQRAIMAARAQGRNKQDKDMADKLRNLHSQIDEKLVNLLDNPIEYINAILLEKNDNGDYNVSLEDIEVLRQLEILGNTRVGMLELLDDHVKIRTKSGNSEQDKKDNEESNQEAQRQEPYVSADEIEEMLEGEDDESSNSATPEDAGLSPELASLLKK